MADESLTEGGPTASICPWCSASYTGDPEDCPSCGATLTPDPAIDPALPGLTAIDTAAIVRSKTPVNKPRNRLLSWISGEYPDEGPSTKNAAAKNAAALAPPDQAVRREILRLELEAEVANLQAEADAILAEAAVEGRLPASAAGAPAADAAPAGDGVPADAVADVAPEAAADPGDEAPKA